jgi:hypothetical protein
MMRSLRGKRLRSIQVQENRMRVLLMVAVVAVVAILIYRMFQKRG